MAAPISIRLSCVFLLLCILNFPIIEQLDQSKFENGIKSVDDNGLDILVQKFEHVLTFFHDGICDNVVCKKAKRELELVLTETSLSGLVVVSTHSPANEKHLGIANLPNLVFFHNGSPNIYPGGEIDVQTVVEWTEGSENQRVTALDDTNFEHLTQAASGATTGDWLVVFYKASCSDVILPVMPLVANRLRGRVVVARVDMGYSQQLVKRLGLKDCPTLRLFRAGSMYTFDLPRYDLQSIVKFAEGWYRNSRMSRVPAELTPFDALTEYIAISLKEAVQKNQLVPLLLGGAVLTLVVTLLCVCYSSTKSPTKVD